MKKNYKILVFLLILSTVSTSSAQAQCSLSGGSVYVDFQSGPNIMMNASVNGISQYTYSWNTSVPVGNVSQTVFYSGWCVTITDDITGCDTIICESCIPTGGIGPCPMIYNPVCGCDGNVYDNDCIAMQNGIFSFTQTYDSLGNLICNSSSQICTVAIDASGPLTFCEGGSVTLTANPSLTTASYSWSTGDTSTSITVINSGTYTVTFTNDTGCVATATESVLVYPATPLNVVTIPSPAVICPGDSCIIQVAQGLNNYSWNTGNPIDANQSQVVVFPNIATTYIVGATDSNGCSVTASIPVTIDTCGTVGVINTLATQVNIYPNPSTGKVTIKLPSDEIFNLNIYDILGKLVFTKANVQAQYVIAEGELLPGNYIFKLEHDSGLISRKLVIE